MFLSKIPIRSFSKPITRCTTGLNSRFCVILGSQWGDEGKGKLVDILAKDYDLCGRFNGGANAGHTVLVDGKKYAFHLLPCGILYPKCVNILGNGVVVHIPTMFEELEQLDKNGVDYKGRLKLSNRAHIVSDI
jgi:adenylosuccinate synthase